MTGNILQDARHILRRRGKVLMAFSLLAVCCTIGAACLKSLDDSSSQVASPVILAPKVHFDSMIEVESTDGPRKFHAHAIVIQGTLQGTAWESDRLPLTLSKSRQAPSQKVVR